MDTLKGEIGRGQVRFRVGRGNFRLEASNQIKKHQLYWKPSRRNDISPQSQGKQLISCATLMDDFIHYIQKIFGQGGQDATKSLMDMNTIDLNAEKTTRNSPQKNTTG